MGYDVKMRLTRRIKAMDSPSVTEGYWRHTHTRSNDIQRHGERLHNMMDLDKMYMNEYKGVQYFDKHLNDG